MTFSSLNAGIESWRGGGVGGAQALDDGEDADQQEAGAHEDVAEIEDQQDELADDGQAGEGDGVRQGAEALREGDFGHHLVGGFSHQRAYGHDGVAVGAQGVNEDGQGGDSGGALAAAVVKQDDGAAELRLGLHGLQLVEDGLGDLGGRPAGILVPGVGAYFGADDGVSVLLDAHDRGGLVVGVGLLVDVVGWAEVEGLNAELAGEEALGELEFEIELAVGDFADVGMGPGVVADLMTLAYHALHEADIILCLRADEHERTLDALVAENIENLGSPLGVRSVVEGEGDLVGAVSVLLNDVGTRIDIHVLIEDELAARVLFVAVHLDSTLAGLGQAGDADDVAIALVVHIMAGLYQAEGLERVGVTGLVPNAP